MSCPISKDITFDCTKIKQGGLGSPDIYIINLDDWKNATVTVDATSKEIASITLAAGGVEGFKFSAPKQEHIIATTELRTNDGVPGYDHMIDVRLATVEQLDKDQFEKLQFGKVVAIVATADGRAILYGGWADDTPTPQGQGLRISEVEYNLSDGNVAGTIRFMLRTPEGQAPEIKMPMTIESDVDLSTLLTATT